MFLGGGANGKSTLVNVLTKLMGDYAANTAAGTLMASNSNQVGDDLIRLAGARYITAAETEHGQRSQRLICVIVYVYIRVAGGWFMPTHTDVQTDAQNVPVDCE